MTLPASFKAMGFQEPSAYNQPRLMIGTDGPAGSGKTEFALSAPGPGLVLCLDRGFDAMLKNPNPPPTRRKDFAFKVIQAPLATQTKQEQYKDYWKKFYEDYRGALENKDAKTIVIDGDSDSWELQRLAEFGKLTQIKSIHYAGVNAARRAMYARGFDSGKIIIATNKIRKDYANVYNEDGSVAMEDGRPKKQWDGKSYERQGFDDQDYLFAIQLRHVCIDPYTDKDGVHPPQWGFIVMKCKPNPSLIGAEFWGEDCNFTALVREAFPTTPLSFWGLK